MRMNSWSVGGQQKSFNKWQAVKLRVTEEHVIQPNQDQPNPVEAYKHENSLWKAKHKCKVEKHP